MSISSDDILGDGFPTTKLTFQQIMKLYSSPSCYHCTQLREELAKAGIDYEYKDLDDDKVREECIDLCKTSGNTELPVVVTNSGKVFNRPKIEDLTRSTWN